MTLREGGHVRPTWQAVYVYYYDDAKDDLILDAVRPLLRRLDGRVERAYFVRHWRRGPHVRIPVLATEHAFSAFVRPAVEEIVGAYLDRHPSRAVLPPDEVLASVHVRLARLEEERGPLRPLVADNTIRWEPHDRRLHVLDGEAGADLLADFYTATNALAFAMLEAVRRGASRELLALSLMLAVAHRHWGDPPSLRAGFISFRSHAEAFLHQSADPDRARAAFDRQSRVNRDRLVRLVHRVVAALDIGDGSVPFAEEWLGALEPFRARAEPLIRSGRLRLSPAAEGQATAAADLTGSSLHRTMFENDAYRALLLQDPAFKSYRLVLNYTYLHLARLGISGYARFRLCHLAADAVEQALDVDAFELVDRFAARHPNSAGTA
jgi:hypothetical protein